MHPLPTAQDKPTPDEPPTSTDCHGEPMAILSHHHGFYHQSPSLWRVWFYHGHGRPWIYEGGNLESCNKMITAEQTGTILLTSPYKCFSLPDKAISDRGPQFASHAFKELGWLLGIKLNMSTVHHPQTDGAMEQSNQEIEAYLSIFCSNNPKIWNSLLPTLKFTFNSKPHATRKESPYFLQLGYDPIRIPTAYQKTNTPANKERLRQWSKARKEAEVAHKLAQQTMMERISLLSCRTLIRKGLFGLIPITRLLASAYVLRLLTMHSASI